MAAGATGGVCRFQPSPPSEDWPISFWIPSDCREHLDDHPFANGAPSISKLAIEGGSLLSGRYWGELRTFLAVAKAKSLNRAARRIMREPDDRGARDPAPAGRYRRPAHRVQQDRRRSDPKRRGNWRARCSGSIRISIR